VKRLQTIGLVMILVLGLIIGCQPGETSSVPKVGQPAPDFQLPDLDGTLVSLSAFQGKPVMLNFWATWCAPCVQEMPYIQEIFGKWSAKGLVVLAINTGEAPSRIEEFMQELNLSFPVLIDIDQNAAENYNIRGIPTTFFIDKEGIIRVTKVGSFRAAWEIEGGINKIMPD